MSNSKRIFSENPETTRVIAIPIIGSYRCALVDEADYDEICTRRWYLKPEGYAFAVFGSRRQGRRYRMMHRVILNAPDGVQVDHANRNRIDNRRCNLRFATATQNMVNAVRPSSGLYRGVEMKSGRWYARIKVDKRDVRLGVFPSPVDAAIAYDSAARKHYGEFALTNFGAETVCAD